MAIHGAPWSSGSVTIFTVGHSTRTFDALVELLRDAGVTALADVRRFPASRRHPQFNRGALERDLPAAGLAYVFLGEALGGRMPARLPAEQSPNAAWQVAAFRHYADAMATPAFQAGFEQLVALAARQPTAFMCAERLWWSCHRRLLADAFVVRGWTVVHLLDTGTRQEHALPPFARVRDGALTYPALL